MRLLLLAPLPFLLAQGSSGPFFTWDTEIDTLVVAGTQFLGDPNVAHTFTGSPHGTNFLKVVQRAVRHSAPP